MAKPLVYTVEIPEPSSHLFHVTATFPDAPGKVRLVFPRWTPGSYLLREHGRHMEQLEVVGQGSVTKVLPHLWEVEHAGGPLTLRYRVYAHELTVRTAHLDDTHGFFNGVNLFLVPEDGQHLPCELTIHAPSGWTVSTTLPQRNGVFHAQDYDHLCDCPVEMGTHRILPFEVRGVPHELILWNRGNEDVERILKDLARAVEINAKVFGGLPYERYLFITHLSDAGRGGLEHRDSTALLFSRFGFKAEKDYEEFITLALHEHFHTWNVKRIKPKVFAPYDFSRENTTRTLWHYEGFTSYYDNFNTRRAGIMAPDRYLAALGELITVLMSTPGRKMQTLEQSSFDAWVKYYRQDEHTLNSGVSYYLKGELVGLCLDLTLRQRSNNTACLDDVMRLLWKWTQERGEGLPEDAMEKAASEVLGQDLKPFFDLAVRSTQELPLAECLAFAGLELVLRAPESADDKGGTPGKGKPNNRASLGLTARKDGVVATVVPGGPAAKANLEPGDQLVALGHFKVNDGSLNARLEEQRPGAVVPVHYFRRDELRSSSVTLEAAPATVAFLRRKEDASPAAVELRKRWMED